MDVGLVIAGMVENFPNLLGLLALAAVLFYIFQQQSAIIADRIAKMDDHAKEDADTIKWLMEGYVGTDRPRNGGSRE